MGIFSVGVSIGDLERHQWEELSATVDTGAFLMSIPGSLLRALGVVPSFTENVQMADGSTKNMDIGHIWLRLNGREVTTYAAFNEDYTTSTAGVPWPWRLCGCTLIQWDKDWSRWTAFPCSFVEPILVGRRLFK